MRPGDSGIASGETRPFGFEESGSDPFWLCPVGVALETGSRILEESALGSPDFFSFPPPGEDSAIIRSISASEKRFSDELGSGPEVDIGFAAVGRKLYFDLGRIVRGTYLETNPN